MGGKKKKKKVGGLCFTLVGSLQHIIYKITHLNDCENIAKVEGSW